MHDPEPRPVWGSSFGTGARARSAGTLDPRARPRGTTSQPPAARIPAEPERPQVTPPHRSNPTDPRRPGHPQPQPDVTSRRSSPATQPPAQVPQPAPDRPPSDHQRRDRPPTAAASSAMGPERRRPARADRADPAPTGPPTGPSRSPDRTPPNHPTGPDRPPILSKIPFLARFFSRRRDPL